MNRLSALVFSALLSAGLSITGAEAAGDAKHPEAIDWSFKGLFGTYDRDSLRRGYKVYTEVCASCHSMNQLRFRGKFRQHFYFAYNGAETQFVL